MRWQRIQAEGQLFPVGTRRVSFVCGSSLGHKRTLKPAVSQTN